MAVSLISMMMVVGTLLPSTARASTFTDMVSDVFDAIAGSFHRNIAEAETVSGAGNSQTMPLPKGALNPGQDTGGGEITIVDDSALVADDGPSGSYSRPKNSTITTYVVREGDTLSGIADLFEVTPSTILWANDLPKGSKLKPGQVLTILPITGVKYTVRKGDTLASIAKKFDGDVTEIVNYNGIDDGTLVVGAEIIIPNGEISAPAPTPAKKITINGTKVTATISAGYYSAPLKSYVRTQGIHGYNGIDMGAPAGTPIYAAAEGDVIVAKQGGYNGGYGSYVVIQHANGSQTLYAHQTTVMTSVGAHVAKGQLIGTVGNSGRVSGPTGYHLHFEIRNGVRNPF